MSGKFYYALPENNETMAKIIASIPPEWQWVDGCLFAPRELIEGAAAVEGAGYAVDRFHSIHPTMRVNSGDFPKEKKGADLFALFTAQKLPGFIQFDEAGYNKYEISLDFAKQVAIFYVKKGYRGWMSFYSGHYEESKYPNPESCSIFLRKEHVAPFMQDEYPEERPPMIKLEWEDVRCRGKKENLEPIASVCRSLGLKEFTPVPARPRASA